MTDILSQLKHIIIFYQLKIIQIIQSILKSPESVRKAQNFPWLAIVQHTKIYELNLRRIFQCYKLLRLYTQIQHLFHFYLLK